ncbi:hypothetical protein CMUS01_12640 [Colletotrichum musicola]|uniref:Uncharacterized protein n=1 Tax=Colletotrichum musicola TaxID=2175873 RepID=A0A8H6MZW8_9PEZI|nr:hypothetical protein CMUS01_12640 [Colletotrichum musicola]
MDASGIRLPEPRKLDYAVVLSLAFPPCPPLCPAEPHLPAASVLPFQPHPQRQASSARPYKTTMGVGAEEGLDGSFYRREDEHATENRSERASQAAFSFTSSTLFLPLFSLARAENDHSTRRG